MPRNVAQPVYSAEGWAEYRRGHRYGTSFIAENVTDHSLILGGIWYWFRRIPDPAQTAYAQGVFDSLTEWMRIHGKRVFKGV